MRNNQIFPLFCLPSFFFFFFSPSRNDEDGWRWYWRFGFRGLIIRILKTREAYMDEGTYFQSLLINVPYRISNDATARHRYWHFINCYHRNTNIVLWLNIVGTNGSITECIYQIFMYCMETRFESTSNIDKPYATGHNRPSRPILRVAEISTKGIWVLDLIHAWYFGRRLTLPLLITFWLILNRVILRLDKNPEQEENSRTWSKYYCFLWMLIL